jgi:hypothetical protein
LTDKLNFDKNTHHIINFLRGIMTEPKDFPFIKKYLRNYPSNLYRPENIDVLTGEDIIRLHSNSSLLDPRTAILDAVRQTGHNDPQALKEHLEDTILKELKDLGIHTDCMVQPGVDIYLIIGDGASGGSVSGGCSKDNLYRAQEDCALDPNNPINEWRYR